METCSNCGNITNGWCYEECDDNNSGWKPKIHVVAPDITVTLNGKPISEMGAFQDLSMFNIKGENMKEYSIYKVYAVNKKTNKVLVDGKTVVAESSDEVLANIKDELIRKNDKLNSIDIYMTANRVLTWNVEEDE